MSAIQEESVDGPTPIIQVLFALHPSFGAQELCGPLEVLSNALHKIKDHSKLCVYFIALDSCPVIDTYQLQAPRLSSAPSPQPPKA